MVTHSISGRHGAGVARLAREDAFFRRHGYTPAPTLLQWMATLRCPLSCPHCLAAPPSRERKLADDCGTAALGCDCGTAALGCGSPAGGGRDRPEGGPIHTRGGCATSDDMPLDAALDLVDQAAKMGVTEFLITGGEPLARADLGEVIARLGRRGVGWSLNTAVMPPPPLRRAIEANPPMFVAVSLDGPADVHDAFRGRPGAFEEALESIRWFAALGGVQVAAGTTVTRFNFARLRETLEVVAGSAADRWGIHLLVPEGRAADRPDLRLSRRQLAWLIRFVARTRTYFPVSMADELGYCGDFEPLLRDAPFRCGAGIAQCVVLPDGEVVPCTTLDRSTSAGNVNARPLAEIWRDGFAELRAWRAAGRCARCDYAPACKGGCWLLRRNGGACYRDTWRLPGVLKTAAGIAICLGLTAAAGAAEPPTAPTTQPATQQPAQPARINAREAMVPETSEAAMRAGRLADPRTQIEPHILWMLTSASQAGRPAPWPEKALSDTLKADPAWNYLCVLAEDKLPADLAERAELIRGALKTEQRSLAVPAILWQGLARWCLDNPDLTKRTPEQRRLLRDTLAELERATTRWRKEIFEKKLDPYLARDRLFIRHHFEMSKILLPAPPYVLIERDTGAERWGGPAGWTDQLAGGRVWSANPAVEALAGWLDRHPYAESMLLTVEAPGMTRLNAAGETEIKAAVPFGVFDVLVTPADAGDVIIGLKSACGADPVWVNPPPGQELTYADLLTLAYRQHTEAMDRQVATGATGGQAAFVRRATLPAANPLLLGAVLKRQRQQAEAAQAGPAGSAPPVAHLGRWPTPQSAVTLWLADFWMF